MKNFEAQKKTRALVASMGGASHVADVLQITRQAVSQWEMVPYRHVWKLARRFGLTPSDIRPNLDGNDEKNRAFS